ncbi:Threonine synthase [Hondaea fermentalgiana]|uniref:Threonine synthase n=1 Tax=Hondaea fermentalgiana TaxID=2315210 RepID=A0A2R5GRT7_9STRA|nr:Threonine synthase [Hondaea fermentalgiana]|eukprot:GBG33597.1 Threonine synthase [Hondaea fermentalgiana]
MSATGEFVTGAVAGVAAAVAGVMLVQQRSKFVKALGLQQKPVYTSTRGFAGKDGKGLDFETAVLAGLGEDGGLFVPSFFPQVSQDTIDSWYGLSFQALAYEIMSLYIPENQVPADKLRDIIDRSYATFRHEEVTPVVRVGSEGEGPKVLELWHGETWAFKDVALSFLGNMFEHFITRRNSLVTVLGATSGDTGSSAIHGLRGKKGVEVFILFPEGRVSPIQELQMTTVAEENVHCLAVKGTFDDAQAIVKAMFRDPSAREQFNLGAVNSINFCRILAQITYYFYSYLRIVPKGSGKRISFSVPTGNFGDILAGYYAKRMGLPVDRLIVATNDNEIVHQFFSRGEYFKPAEVQQTLAPSMDICVSSNFERFLYHMVDDDAETLAAMMKEFEETGKLKASEDLLRRSQAEMSSASLSRSEIIAVVKDNYEKYQYLLDPHSAIGVGAADKVNVTTSDVVCLACAHWGKFTDAAGQAIGEETFAKIPYPPLLEQLKSLPKRKTVLDATKDAVRNEMSKFVKKE